MKNNIKTNERIGLKFGKLTIINLHKEKNPYRYYATVICDCGNQKEVIVQNVILGKTTSCGCVNRERIANLKKTHGLAETPEYYAWSGIKTRCYNKKSQQYNDYGGRGIRMCNDWLHSFEKFLSDMGEKPSADHSIERKNNDGDYEKSNCTWVTTHEQSRNKRNNVWIAIKGETKILSDWCNIFGINKKTVYSRAKNNKTPTDAFFELVKEGTEYVNL